MEDGKNNHPLRLLNEKNGIREAAKQNSPNFSVDSLVVQRVLMCLLICVIQLDHESPAKPVELGFVPVASLPRLDLSATPYDKHAIHESASNLAFTSSHGDPSSGSPRYSL